MLFRHCRLGIVGHGDGADIESEPQARTTASGSSSSGSSGHKRVHGKRVPVLRDRRPRARSAITTRAELRIHWNLKVNGHRLAAGSYLITLRAFDAHRNLLGHTNSVVVTVKH